jgi:hypothetical protein
MSDDQIRIAITGDASGATASIKEVSSSADQLSGALKTVGESGETAGVQIAEGMKAAEFSTTEARHAAHLLGEEIGVRVPRALQSVLASSSTLGPVLAGAFSAIAAIAFIDLAERVGEKLGEVVSSAFIYTDAMKASDAATVILNDELAKQEGRLNASEKAFDRVGLSADKLAKLKIGDELAANLNEVNSALAKANAEISKENTSWVSWLKNASDYYGFTSFAAKDAAEKTAALTNNIAAANRATEEAKATAQEETAILEKQAALKAAASAAEFKRADLVNFADALDHVAKSSEKATIDLAKLNQENEKLTLQSVILQDKEYQAIQEDVANTDVKLNGVLAQQVQLAIQVGQAAKISAQQQEAAMTALEGRLNAVLNTTVLMKKGWAAFGEEAVKNLEEVGLALVKHLAIALLVDDTEKLSHAKTAAAGAYAAESSIPFVGPELGALAAASVFASAMAFEKGGVVPGGSIASCDDGFQVPGAPHDAQLIMAHGGERIMNPSEAFMNNGSKSGGDTHVHIHAMDSQSFERFLKNNPTPLSRAIKHASDTGHLNLPRIARGK